jgi:hypothetical protein
LTRQQKKRVDKRTTSDTFAPPLPISSTDAEPPSAFTLSNVVGRTNVDCLKISRNIGEIGFFRKNIPVMTLTLSDDVTVAIALPA